MVVKIRFLGQGLQQEGESIGSILINGFQDIEFNSFLAFVAFVGVAGISQLREHILTSKTHIITWKVFIGIDQKATSKEALQALIDLDINTKIYFTPTRITYHPKIYLFEGDTKARVVIGSSNLTERGLFNNVEASIIIDITYPDEEGIAVIQQIKTYFQTFTNGENTNIQIATTEIIEMLRARGIVPTEQDRRRIDEKESEEQEETQNNTQDNFRTLFPSTRMQRSPTRQHRERARGETTRARETPMLQEVVNPIIIDIWDTKGRLLWKKENLQASDAQVVSANGTNPTGVLRLSKAENNINSETYFRNSLFGNFEWMQIPRRNNTPIEEIYVRFLLKIGDIDKGEFTLRISHNINRVSNQKNIPTTLHWGNALGIIRENSLVGANLYLYAPVEGTTEPYFIHITNVREAPRVANILDF